MPDSELNVVIKATDQASGELRRIDDRLDRMGGKAKQASKRGGILQMALGFATGQALFGAVTGGLSAIGSQLSQTISLAKVQIDAEKQLAAVLESTGNAAGLTAQQIKDMASGLQNVTNFGDEAIISGQNLLLTFTNIGADTFPRATEAMLDMSQAFGQDMKSSAIQLGKALNDPIAGVTALSRVGVSFTEQQKEMIKSMAEAGDIAGAQAIILAELETQVGGSARAMADPMVQLSNSFGDLKETIGRAVLPVLNRLAQAVLPHVQRAIDAIPPILAILAQQWRDNVLPAIRQVWSFIDTYLLPILIPLAHLVGTQLKLAFEVLSFVFTNVTLPALRAIWRFVDGFVIRTFGSWANVIDGITGAIEGLIGWLDRLRGGLANISIPNWMSSIGGAIGIGGDANTRSQPATPNNIQVTVNATNADPNEVQKSTTWGVQDALAAAGL